MRATGPIRVRRGGDDSRVPQYLGIARKILGEVKRRAAAGGLATLYRALTLADGTWIRVGTVHGQDLVEIRPVAVEAATARSGLFSAWPTPKPTDLIGERILLKLRRGQWESLADSRVAPAVQYVDWHESVPPFLYGRKSVLAWRGHALRYYSDVEIYHLSPDIYLNGWKLCTLPSYHYCLAAGLWTSPEGVRYVRAVCRLSTATSLGTPVVQRRLRQWEGLWEEDPGTPWESLGTFLPKSVEPDAFRVLYALWNGSGTQLVLALHCQYDTPDPDTRPVSFWVVEIGESGVFSAEKLGESATSTMTFTVREGGATPNHRGKTLAVSFSGARGAIAYDWNGDKLVPVEAIIDAVSLESFEGAYWHYESVNKEAWLYPTLYYVASDFATDHILLDEHYGDKNVYRWTWRYAYDHGTVYGEQCVGRPWVDVNTGLRPFRDQYDGPQAMMPDVSLVVGKKEVPVLKVRQRGSGFSFYSQREVVHVYPDQLEWTESAHAVIVWYETFAADGGWAKYDELLPQVKDSTEGSFYREIGRQIETSIEAFYPLALDARYGVFVGERVKSNASNMPALGNGELQLNKFTLSGVTRWRREVRAESLVVRDGSAQKEAADPVPVVSSYLNQGDETWVAHCPIMSKTRAITLTLPNILRWLELVKASYSWSWASHPSGELMFSNVGNADNLKIDVLGAGHPAEVTGYPSATCYAGILAIGGRESVG